MTGSEYNYTWGASERHHTFTINASDFTSGTENSPINLRIYRAGGVVWFDNVSVSVSVLLPGLKIIGFGEGTLDVAAHGLDPSQMYRLLRGTNLTLLSDVVGYADSNVTTHVFTDTNPPPLQGFYRMEEAADP